MRKNAIHEGPLFESTYVKIMAQISFAIGDLERAVTAESRLSKFATRREQSAARRRSFDARHRLEQLIATAITERTLP